MTAVMIGVDPHKGSHTAVAIDAAEEPLGKLRVRASAGQAQRLVAWAAAWPERTWAVEGAGGLAPYPPADRISSRGLALYRGASLPGLAAAWPGRGTSASTVIRHARRGPVSPDRGLGAC